MFACKMTKHNQRPVIRVLVLCMLVLGMVGLVSSCDLFVPADAGSSHASAISQSEVTTSQSISPSDRTSVTDTHAESSSNIPADGTSSKDSATSKTSDKLLVPLIVLLVLLLVIFFPLLLYVLVRLKKCEKIVDRNMRLFDQSRDKQKSSGRNTSKNNTSTNGSLSNWWDKQPDYVTRSEYESLEQRINQLMANPNQTAVSRPQEQQAASAIANQSIIKANNNASRSMNVSANSQSTEELKRIFNQYDQYSEQEISQIQNAHNFVSMRVEQYVSGALSSAVLSDSNGKDARYLRPANPGNAGGQFYVIPNPTNRNYSEIELGYIASLFDVPHQTYTGNKPIKLINPAIITRSGKAFSLIQKGQIEFL